MGILEVNRLQVRYGSGATSLLAVDQASLTVPSSGTLGLVGESGSGKSTVARALMGVIPAASGSVLLDGEDYSKHSRRASIEYRRFVQMVFQDPFASLNPRMTVGAMIVEALGMRPELRRDRTARRREAVRMLDLVGFPARALEKYPHQFSGGQRQRLAIARALSVRPKVLICDEITSALDVSVQAAVLGLLQDLQREFSLSYLFISHDLGVVRAISDRVAVMYLGQIVEEASSESLFAAPTHPYTSALIASLPALEGDRTPAPLTGDVPDPRNPPTGCRFRTRCPVGPVYRPDRIKCTNLDPQQDSAQRVHSAACHFTPRVEPAAEAPVTSPETLGVGVAPGGAARRSADRPRT